MREIELKFKVENLEDVKRKLINSECEMSEELHQKDTIFVSDLNDTKSEEGKIFIRIRKENEKIELNLKKQGKERIESKEIEFNVDSFEKTNDFLETLGLKQWVTVEKTRVTTKYKEFNICIDVVKELGNFVEIELLTDDNLDIEICKNKLLEIAKELNINTENIVKKHYDTMMNELKGSK